MTTKTPTDRIDIFPFLLGALLVIYLFYLLRPPTLMFWYYGLGMGQSAPLQQELGPPSVPEPPPPATAFKTPPLPAKLTQPVASWTPAPPPPAAIDVLNQEIDRLTNQQRQAYGRPALAGDPELRRIATQHSWDMLTNSYLDHISPDGIGPQQRVGKQHRRLFGTTGENVEMIDSAPAPAPQLAIEFVDNWMNSLGHRRNILSGDFTHMAAGCYQDLAPPRQERRRCTQLFARVFAWSEQNLPDTAGIGQTLNVRLRAAEGNALPTQLLQVNLRDGRQVSAVPLSASGDTASGQLTLQGPEGAYSLTLHIPDRQDSTHYWIVPGPYVYVK